MIRHIPRKMSFCLLVIGLFLLQSCTKSITISGKERGLCTYILVRHAEKDNNHPQDPDLSSAGKIRALKLAEMFREWEIDQFYSTDYKRTLQTIEPLMDISRKEAIIYNPSNLDTFSNQLKSITNKTILIVGHSNTTPRLANLLGETTIFTDWPDSEYGNIVIVQRAAGHEPKVSVLKY